MEGNTQDRISLISRLPTRGTFYPELVHIMPEANDWAKKIADIMKEQPDLKPTEQSYIY
jgi:hypothetical protein